MPSRGREGGGGGRGRGRQGEGEGEAGATGRGEQGRKRDEDEEGRGERRGSYCNAEIEGGCRHSRNEGRGGMHCLGVVRHHEPVGQEHPSKEERADSQRNLQWT
eukprot:750082-Hanusia_phi.AAC.2